MDKNQKLSNSQDFFINLGSFQALGVIVFLSIMLIGGKADNTLGIILLVLYVGLTPVMAITAVINLVGLPIYLATSKPRGKGLFLGIVSLLISVAVVMYAGYTAYSVFMAPR